MNKALITYTDSVSRSGTLQDVIQIYESTGNHCSKELGEACLILINQSHKSLKTALFLIDNTKSYVEFNCDSLKGFIIKHTSLTYDAAFKQLEAARVAAQHFGINYIDYFADAPMRTLMQVQNFALREKIIEKICNDHGVTRFELTRKMLTAPKIMATTNKITGRPFFNKSYRLNKLTRDVYDSTYCSGNPINIHEPVAVYGSEVLNVFNGDALDESVINFDINYDSRCFKEKIYFTHSPLELRLVIERDFPEFYHEYVKNKFLNQAEYAFIIFSLGCLKMSHEYAAYFICHKVDEQLFSDEDEARDYLNKLDDNGLLILINVLDNFGFNHRETNDSRIFSNLRGLSAPQLVDTIITFYKHVWCNTEEDNEPYYDVEQLDGIDHDEKDEDKDVEHEDDDDDEVEWEDDDEDEVEWEDEDGDDDDDEVEWEDEDGDDDDDEVEWEDDDDEDELYNKKIHLNFTKKVNQELNPEELELILNVINKGSSRKMHLVNDDKIIIPEELKLVSTEILKNACQWPVALSIKKAIILGLAQDLEETEIYFAYKCFQEAIMKINKINSEKTVS